LLKKEQKWKATYIRRNSELKKLEMLGYGAELGTMNASYFTVDDACNSFE